MKYETAGPGACFPLPPGSTMTGGSGSELGIEVLEDDVDCGRCENSCENTWLSKKRLLCNNLHPVIYAQLGRVARF